MDLSQSSIKTNNWSVDNMSPQWIVHLSPRYSQVALLSTPFSTCLGQLASDAQSLQEFQVLTLRLNIDWCIRPLIIHRLVTVKLPSQSEFILSLDEFGNRYYCGDKEIATTLLRMFMMNLIQTFEKKIHTKGIHHEISSYFFLQAMFNVISCKPSPIIKLTSSRKAYGCLFPKSSSAIHRKIIPSFTITWKW